MGLVIQKVFICKCQPERGPFILQGAIHSFLLERQIGGIRPTGTGRLFAIASGRTLKVIHQNRFPSPKLFPAQLSWCCLDELAVSSCVCLHRQRCSYTPAHPAIILSEEGSCIHFPIHALMYHGSLCMVVQPYINRYPTACHQTPALLEHLFWSCPVKHGNHCTYSTYWSSRNAVLCCTLVFKHLTCFTLFAFGSSNLQTLWKGQHGTYFYVFVVVFFWRWNWWKRNKLIGRKIDWQHFL